MPAAVRRASSDMGPEAEFINYPEPQLGYAPPPACPFSLGGF